MGFNKSKKGYQQYINENNRSGSGKASSYITALNMLDQIMSREPLFGLDEFWSIESVDVIGKLYQFALKNQKKAGSVFLQKDLSPSYGQSGYYSAALNSFREFLVVSKYEDRLRRILDDPNVPTGELAKRMGEIEAESAEALVEIPNFNPASREGKEILRQTKARLGQDFFRKMILDQYNRRCCLSGLDVLDVLRASHIAGWAEDEENRLNPANGLCLSATYDAAFDRYLISFDDDYRMILGSDLKDHCTSQAYKDYFEKKEGQRILLPTRNDPDLQLLRRHRDRMIG